MNTVQNHSMRTVQLNNTRWFVGKDAALTLGYTRPGNALAAFVDRRDVRTALIPGKRFGTMTNVILINQSGLCSLVQHCRLHQ